MRERQIYQQKVDAVAIAAVRHDMTQGFVPHAIFL